MTANCYRNYVEKEGNIRITLNFSIVAEWLSEKKVMKCVDIGIKVYRYLL